MLAPSGSEKSHFCVLRINHRIGIDDKLCKKLGRMHACQLRKLWAYIFVALANEENSCSRGRESFQRASRVVRLLLPKARVGNHKCPDLVALCFALWETYVWINRYRINPIFLLIWSFSGGPWIPKSDDIVGAHARNEGI